MVFYEVFNSPIIHDDENFCAETAWQIPRFVTVMLQNVCLCDEKTTPPIEYTGDFWYWKLTSYGLDLMRALVRASVDGFSYFETFMEPELEVIPQLVLLDQLNAVIHSRLTDPYNLLDWGTIFEHSQYLRDKSVTVNTGVFECEVDCLIARIRQGRYDPSGNSIYRSPRNAGSETPNTNK